ncbi:MAG: NUDIX domain-containing protein [Bacteroidetes bacterium]|nr:NUDIX domain-containing protein [Bacteroidota bacterium]
MGKVRVGAKAIIIQEGQILLTKNQDSRGIYYMLPGGGQENGERIDEALRRECMEEAGIQVHVKELAFVRDYIARNHQIPDGTPDHFHQIELIFYCEILPGEEAGNGTDIDDRQIGVEWIAVNKLEDEKVYPVGLLPYLTGANKTPVSIYLGDIN